MHVETKHAQLFLFESFFDHVQRDALLANE